MPIDVRKAEEAASHLAEATPVGLSSRRARRQMSGWNSIWPHHFFAVDRSVSHSNIAARRYPSSMKRAVRDIGRRWSVANGTAEHE